jgi:hypothetical protein
MDSRTPARTGPIRWIADVARARQPAALGALRVIAYHPGTRKVPARDFIGTRFKTAAAPATVTGERTSINPLRLEGLGKEDASDEPEARKLASRRRLVSGRGVLVAAGSNRRGDSVGVVVAEPRLNIHLRSLGFRMPALGIGPGEPRAQIRFRSFVFKHCHCRLRC